MPSTIVAVVARLGRSHALKDWVGLRSVAHSAGIVVGDGSGVGWACRVFRDGCRRVVRGVLDGYTTLYRWAQA